MWISKLFPEITLVVLISSAFILCVYLQENKNFHILLFICEINMEYLAL